MLKSSKTIICGVGSRLGGMRSGVKVHQQKHHTIAYEPRVTQMKPVSFLDQECSINSYTIQQNISENRLHS